MGLEVSRSGNAALEAGLAPAANTGITDASKSRTIAYPIKRNMFFIFSLLKIFLYRLTTG
jgi:hypothetical protein